MYKLLFSVGLLFGLSGCIHPPEKVSAHRSLAHMIEDLYPEVSQKEAAKLSSYLYRQAAHIKNSFQLVSPPQWHNFLVNIGVKKQGLCYQISDALYSHLKRDNYPHLRFHLAVSDKGYYFKEHNAVVITGYRHEFEDGIIIDVWRHSGKLFYEKVKEDRAYHWIHRDDRCECQNGK